MNSEIETRLAALAANRTQGASALGAEAAQILLLAADSAGCEDVLQFLEQAQPSMATIVGLAREARACGAATGIRALCEARLRRAEFGAIEIAGHARTFIPDGARVFTHSRSATVEFLLRQERSRLAEVLVTESNPGGEGAALAGAIGATLIADAEIYRAMTRATIAIVGADAVTPTSVINKIGTSLMALAARELRRPCYALAGIDKLINIELTPGPLFEPVPRTWFTAIVTEEGLRH